MDASSFSDSPGTSFSAADAISQVPVLDEQQLEVLNELQGDGTDDLLKEVAGLFLDEATQALPKLAMAAASGDLAAIKSITHSLKGSGDTLGAGRIKLVAAELESAANEGQSNRFPGLIDRLEKELSMLRAALDDYYRRTG